MEHAGFKALEIYDRGRYFTMTGDIYGENKPIRDVDIADLKIPQKRSTASHSLQPILTKDLEVLINRIKAEKDGMQFTALHDHGDLTQYGGDQSRADLAYIGIVAKWTNFDIDLTDRIYRQSKLMRSKWDESHRSDGMTYGEMTIRKVLGSKRIYNQREHEGYLSYHYRFRYNVVTSRTEVENDGQ